MYILLLKSSGLTFESWNAIICNKSIHRASLYCNLWNLVKKMIGHVTWSLLSIELQGSSQLGSRLASILFCSCILSIVIAHSVIVTPCIYPPAHILEISHVQILAWLSMQSGLAMLWTGAPSLMSFWCYYKPSTGFYGYWCRSAQYNSAKIQNFRLRILTDLAESSMKQMQQENTGKWV